MSLLFFVVAVTLAVSAMCSLFEATLYSTRIATLEAAKADGRHPAGAEAMLAMKRDVARPTSAILILNTVANTAGATVAGMLAAVEFGSGGVPVFSAALTLGILFLSEILPKTTGAVHWRALWPVVVWPLALIQKLLRPLVWFTQRFSGLFVKGTSHSVTTEDEILAMIRLGAKAGELTPTELELLTAVFQFDEVVVRQVMVPRGEVEYFDVTWSFARCLELARRSKHTRYPLCEGSFDSPIGLVHVKDLIGIAPESDLDLRKVSRPLRSVPETMPIRRLLREMQTTHRHMVAVIDEYGTAMGIATLENVIEQLVGSVQDEFDDEGPEIVPEQRGVYVVHGMTPVVRVNRGLGLSLGAPTAVDTISGLLVSKVGRLLEVGDRVQFDGATAEVVEVVGNRAKRIRFTLAEPPEEDSDSA